MSQVFQLKLPMRMETNKGGDKESLNLNIYRNLHFRKLSHQKNAFHRKIDPLLSGFPKLGKISLHYEVHPKTNGRLDTMNVGSIVDKYFSDTLVEAGVILDDDYTNVVFNSFSFGSVCPDDPHVLVTITEIEPRSNQPMRVLLDQNEIQQALENYILTMGLSGVNSVELSADSEGNINAEVVMGAPTLPRPNAPAYRELPDNSGIIVRPKRGGRPLGSKNKPKEADADVATTGQDSSHSNGAGTVESTEEEDLYSDSDDETDEEDNGVEPTQSNGVSSKNLFGDSDTESANTSDLDEEQDKEADFVEINPAEIRVKKSSIFDE